MGAFTVTKKPSVFDLCPAGNYPGVLVAMVDLGTHEKEYKDEKKGTSRMVKERRVYLAWEIDQEKQGGGGNFIFGRVYVVSVSDKSALGKMIASWRGKKVETNEEIDLMKMLGKACLVTVTNQVVNEKTYHNFEGVAPMPKGMAAYKAETKPWSWSIDAGDIPDAVDGLPYSYGEPIKEIIERSDEWKDRSQSGHSATNNDANEPAIF